MDAQWLLTEDPIPLCKCDFFSSRLAAIDLILNQRMPHATGTSKQVNTRENIMIRSIVFAQACLNAVRTSGDVVREERFRAPALKTADGSIVGARDRTK